jgi:uncharacterized Zn-binding protein involved in type VI secretion
MPRGAARLNDLTLGDCAIHGPNIKGKIITASSNTIVNNRGVARLNDTVQADCGHTAKIVTGSGTVNVNNRPYARLNDEVGNSPYTAKIITASSDTDLT